MVFQRCNLNLGACGCVLGAVHHTFFFNAMLSSAFEQKNQRKNRAIAKTEKHVFPVILGKFIPIVDV
jgi:hypothetical protein